jgi:hypothetical protein
MFPNTIGGALDVDNLAELSGPVIKGAILAGSGRSQWSTRESPRSTETQ